MKHKLDEMIATQMQHMNSHKCEVTDEDYKQIIPKIELLERLSGFE